MAATLNSDDEKVKIELWFCGLLPSAFVKYWFDEDGILHQRVIEESEWRESATISNSTKR